jgi:hypothetical protein
MIEILLILLLVAGILLFPLLQQIDPWIVLIVIVIILNLINAGMTVINAIQACRQDPRFLSAGYLGLIQVLVGIALLVTFSLTLGQRLETGLSGGPFLLGGMGVMILFLVRTIHRKR